MTPDKFPPEVIEHLNRYVYRLIDPRNGETFYVGKGQGNRVFEHVQGVLAANGDEDADGLKAQRIKEIHAAKLEVIHVIHRHGIESDAVAYQIEAALIDAYPGLANRVGGHDSGDFGVRHAVEIISEYMAEPFVAQEPLMLINIGASYNEQDTSIYEAVRGCWRINPENAGGYKLVLAHRNGIVVGAFRPTEWVPATPANFPWLETELPRWGFVGEPADAATKEKYLNKRVPDEYRRKGAANPVRYVQPPTKPA